MVAWDAAEPADDVAAFRAVTISASAPNVLLITLDQLRADCLSCAGHPLVRTPNLDRLAAAGVRFARHYSQAAPCSPGRASLYTGMYQFNHRVVANGTPLDGRFDNVFAAAERAGRSPVVFGYTDQSIDPRLTTGPDDPRLSQYSPGWLPGAHLLLGLPDDPRPWVEWLTALGYDTSVGAEELLATEHRRPDEHSISAFLTDRALAWFVAETAAADAEVADAADETRDEGAHADLAGRPRGGRAPWFVHLSYLRPHPPFSAAGHWGVRFEALGAELDAVVGPPLAIPAEAGLDRFHERALTVHGAAAPRDADALRQMRAHYFGMIEHVDHQVGRILDHLERTGAWDDTIIVLSADHAEMLGDHGLLGKLGYWEQSYAIPCIVRDPRCPATHGTVVDRFTENVDVMPTICALTGVDVPAQCDGRSLVPFLDGRSPDDWRDAAHWEFDWRYLSIGPGVAGSEVDRALAEQHLAVLRDATHMYVQFGDGQWLCCDLAADPTGRTRTTDPAVVLPLAQRMLVWRARHAERTLTDMLCERGRIGRWPSMPTGWVRAGTPDA